MDMILFKQDWQRFPTAFVDYDTKNTSFLRIVKLYKKMGIDNCDFPLALYTPDLVGVDPHDPNLSTELKNKVAMEAMYNPWYFFREVVRVPVSGGQAVPFEANRGNMALYWCYFNHIDIALLQIRQTGKTTGACALTIGLMDVWVQGTNISLLTKSTDLRGKTIQQLKDIRSTLPSYIYKPNRNEIDNTETFSNKLRKNLYSGAVGRSDKISADKIGRGLTVPTIHCDEMAYISHVGTTIPVALASASAARDQAAQFGQPYGNIFTTTAGDLTTRDGQYAHSFMTGGYIWSEKLFDLTDQQELQNIVDKNTTGQKPIIYAAFNHQQLGKTDQWLYKKIRESAAHGDIADRDWFNIWTMGGSTSPLTEVEKQSIRKSQMEPRHVSISSDGYTMRWYLDEYEIDQTMENSSFALGLDTSDALGGDNDAIGLVLINLKNHHVIAAGRYNETNLSTFALFIANFLIQYPTVVLIPERKSSASSMLDKIFLHLHAHGVDPFKRIYNRIVDDLESRKSDYEQIKKPMSSRSTHLYNAYKRDFGFNTSGSGRHARDALYIEALRESLRMGATCVHDAQLIMEINGLVDKNGRVDHADGSHDDLVIAWLLSHWLGSRARNLDHYGINPRQVFLDTKKPGEDVSVEAEFKHEKELYYKEEMTALFDELRSCENTIRASQIEGQLKRLATKIDTQEVMGESIDAMIHQVEEEKKRKRRQNTLNATGDTAYVANQSVEFMRQMFRRQ